MPRECAHLTAGARGGRWGPLHGRTGRLGLDPPFSFRVKASQSAGVRSADVVHLSIERTCGRFSRSRVAPLERSEESG